MSSTTTERTSAPVTQPHATGHAPARAGIDPRGPQFAAGVTALVLIAILGLMVIGIRIYSSSTGLHIRSAAQMLVENRQLSEDLADALAQRFARLARPGAKAEP